VKKLTLCFLLLLSILALSAQPLWNWGFSLQVGQSQERTYQTERRTSADFSYREYSLRGGFEPTYGLGVWLERPFTSHWSLQTGLSYRRLMNTEQQQNYAYSSQHLLTELQEIRTTLSQQLLEVPFRIRYYFRDSKRLVRPFLSGQLMPVYMLSVKETTVRYRASQNRPLVQTSVWERTFDYTEYGNLSPLQLTYGLELGVRWSHFSLSVAYHQRLATRKDISKQACPRPNFLDANILIPCFCGEDLSAHGRVLNSTNLQLQYQF